MVPIGYGGLGIPNPELFPIHGPLFMKVQIPASAFWVDTKGYGAVLGVLQSVDRFCFPTPVVVQNLQGSECLRLAFSLDSRERGLDGMALDVEN